MKLSVLLFLLLCGYIFLSVLDKSTQMRTTPHQPKRTAPNLNSPKDFTYLIKENHSKEIDKASVQGKISPFETEMKLVKTSQDDLQKSFIHELSLIKYLNSSKTNQLVYISLLSFLGIISSWSISKYIFSSKNGTATYQKQTLLRNIYKNKEDFREAMKNENYNTQIFEMFKRKSPRIKAILEENEN